METVLDSFHRSSREPHVVFLDSVTGGLSLVASRPRVLFSCNGRNVKIRWVDGRQQNFVADPFEVLDDLLVSHRREAPDGMAIGYLGYELKDVIEKLPARALNDVGLPDAWFGFYNHVNRFRIPASDAPTSRRADVSVPSSNFSRASYLAAVHRAKEYIAAGDIYQVNLSQRFHAQTDASSLDLYQSLRSSNPAPFAAYLDLGDAQILSSSPESFLRLDNRRVITRPIKGTRPRLGDPDRDAITARELLTSVKDNAELLMITDLLRNDIGRVCEFGSVHVPELVRLEEYATVFHLVSTIEGTLRPDISHVAALRACFPGGSITGAPKIRSMEIIDELEPHARGVYTGVIGYFGYDGISHFNIAIRTMVKKGRDVYFHAGGGIVSDSDPAMEYEETLAKARGMMAALEQLATRRTVEVSNQ